MYINWIKYVYRNSIDVLTYVLNKEILKQEFLPRKYRVDPDHMVLNKPFEVSVLCLVNTYTIQEIMCHL